MPTLTLKLGPVLFEELKAAALAVSDGEPGYRPEMFAQECVEVILASRRLRRMPPAPYGARPGNGRVIEAELEPEPEPYRVLEPQWSR